MWSLVRIAAYTQTTFLSDHIVAIYPPLKHDSGLVLGISKDTIDGELYYIGTTPLFYLFFSLSAPHLYPLFIDVVPDKVIWTVNWLIY